MFWFVKNSTTGGPLIAVLPFKIPLIKPTMAKADLSLFISFLKPVKKAIANKIIIKPTEIFKIVTSKNSKR